MRQKSTNSIFSKGFWATAAGEFHNPKSLIFAGLTIALGTVLSSLYIPIGLNLRITFSYLVIIFASMILGPVVGLATGFAYDLISFLIFPSGEFFLGYTLSTMLEFFIYGLFLYRSQLSILRIFIMKLIVNFGIHTILGSLWSKILFNKGYYYFFTKSIIKNTLVLPVEVIMIVILMQIFLPFLVRDGLMPKQKGKRIPLI